MICVEVCDLFTVTSHPGAKLRHCRLDEGFNVSLAGRILDQGNRAATGLVDGIGRGLDLGRAVHHDHAGTLSGKQQTAGPANAAGGACDDC